MSWQSVTLADVCELKYGKSLPDAKRSGGAVPVFGSNGIVGRHNESITAGPSIIIGRKGSLGEVNFSDVPCWPIDTTYFVDETATKADLKWLSYRLQGLGLTRLNKSAAVPGLNREDAYRQRLLLPPLPEQRRIAAILDQADALRAKRREALAQLDSLTQSIFIEMFGEIDNKGWTMVTVDDVAMPNGGMRKGAIMSGLNMGIIKAMPIPMVPITLQKEFSDRNAELERLKVSQRAALTELETLFASLQHRAFRGEL